METTNKSGYRIPDGAVMQIRDRDAVDDGLREGVGESDEFVITGRVVVHLPELDEDGRARRDAWRDWFVEFATHLKQQAKRSIFRARRALAIGVATLVVAYGIGLLVVSRLMSGVMMSEYDAIAGGVVLFVVTCSIVSVGITLVGAWAVVMARAYALEQYSVAGGQLDRAKMILDLHKIYSINLARWGLCPAQIEHRAIATDALVEEWNKRQADQGGVA